MDKTKLVKGQIINTSTNEKLYIRGIIKQVGDPVLVLYKIFNKKIQDYDYYVLPKSRFLKSFV